MNKKIKKAAAIMAAAVLCLSMSMTVFASDRFDYASPDAGDIPAADDQETETEVEKEISQIWSGIGLDKDGNKVTVKSEKVSAEVEEILKDEDAVKDILKDAGYEVGDDHQVVVLGAGDFQTVDMYGKPIEQDISEGVGLNFGLGYHYKDGFSENNWENVKDIKDGDTIYVLHQKDDGTWEVLEGKAVVEDTEYYTRVSVEVNLTSLSPVAFIKVMSDGEVVVLDKTETPVQKVDTKTAKTTTVTVKKSPKTGE